MAVAIVVVLLLEWRTAVVAACVCRTDVLWQVVDQFRVGVFGVLGVFMEGGCCWALCRRLIACCGACRRSALSQVGSIEKELGAPLADIVARMRSTENDGRLYLPDRPILVVRALWCGVPHGCMGTLSAFAGGVHYISFITTWCAASTCAGGLDRRGWHCLPP